MKKIFALSLVILSTSLLSACDDSSQDKLDQCLDMRAAFTDSGHGINKMTDEEYEKKSKLFHSMKCPQRISGAKYRNE